MKALVLLLLLLSVGACNQVMLASGHALRNAVSLPLDGLRSLRNYATGENHNEYRRRTLDLSSQETDQPLACLVTPPAETGLENLESFMTSLRDTSCTCQTWGTCSAASCPCETLCPNHYGIFQRPGRHPSTFPLAENDLPFRNQASVFSEGRHPMTHGYCWGHTAIHQQLFRLGFFDPEQPAPYEEGSAEWAHYYRDILRDINNNKVREIPGFSSINEFTSHPTIQEYLINDIVPNTWARHAMSYEGLRATLNTSQSMTAENTRHLVQDIRERIDQFHVAPKLLFSSKVKKNATHIVAVHEVREEDGQTILCLTDSNFRASYNSQCLSRIVVQEDGTLRFSNWMDDEITNVSVPSQDNAEMVAQAQSLRAHCESQTRGCPAQ